MKQRVITAIFILAVAIPVLIFSHTVVYPLVLAALAVGAIFELFRVLGIHRTLTISLPAYILAALLPLGAFFYMKNGGAAETYLLINFLLLFLYMLMLFFLAVMAQGKLAFADLASAFAGATYVVSAFTSLSLLRYVDGGAYVFALVFVAAWVCDVFAYFVGYLFGKHKLIPAISPKKTVEGSLGGIFFAVVAFLLYGFLIGRFTDLVPDYVVLGVSGLVLSVISQIGDLIASLIKREHEVKDYGTIFPGHGGIMDRFDSVLAVSTALMAIFVIAPPFH